MRPATQDIYSVNCITFHPTFGTFATTGSDGTFNFWDKVHARFKHDLTPPAPPTPPRFTHSARTPAVAQFYGRPRLPLAVSAHHNSSPQPPAPCPARARLSSRPPSQDSRQRLKAFSKANMPIPVGAFNRDGTIFAYAVSYDWSKGSEHHNPRTVSTEGFEPLVSRRCAARRAEKPRTQGVRVRKLACAPFAEPPFAASRS